MRAGFVAIVAGQVGMAAFASSARAQAAETVNLSVDATAAGAPLERVWAFHGYDELNYTTAPEGQALLGEIVAAHTAPVHVRNHFLLNNGDGAPALKWGSTDVYNQDDAGSPVYSWTLTDGIIDTITAVGAFPLVEIGFMPESLSTHPVPYRNSSSTTLDGGCFYPPADYTKWDGLIRAWATHANQRYPNVTDSWLWELWNEPDLGYWRGTFAEYATLYDYTESALHAVIPAAPLGGPAVAGAGGTFLRQFLQHCATGINAVTGETGTRLDLVTFHAKGGVSVIDGHVQMNLGTQLRLHRAGFEAVAGFPQFTQTPIYITEADPDGCAACPASSIPADAYRNSTAYGAYEIAMMKRTLEIESQVGIKLGGMLTWAFTFPGTPYFAGYRALATNGINLPVLSAFKLLGRLIGARLPVTSSGAGTLDSIVANGVRGLPDVDGMATLDGSVIRILVWNYHDDIVTAAASPVRLSVKLPAGFGSRVRVSHQRVDESHGDAYTAWVSQGMPANPSTAQIAALRRAMDPALLVPDQTLAVSAGGSVGVDFGLPRFGVSLVTVVPVDTGDAGMNAGAGGGCGCRAGGRGAGTTGSSALREIGALLLAAGAWSVRRRSARRGRPWSRASSGPNGTLDAIP